MLRISKADYDLIRWEAERSYPHECCGVILGNLVDVHRVVTLTVPCENMRRDTPASRYSINPEQVKLIGLILPTLLPAWSMDAPRPPTLMCCWAPRIKNSFSRKRSTSSPTGRPCRLPCEDIMET